MDRKIKSYVLRTGRVSNRQQQGLEHYLKDYQLDIGADYWDLEQAFNRNADIIVEIGFGMGASLAIMAAQNPELNYIGIEVHQAGVGSLVAELHDKHIDNVRVVRHDAVEVFQKQLQDNSLTGVQIFFPDPWHKKRHHKRRLIQAEFIKLLTQKIRPGGWIHCATDWQDYAEHMLQVLTASPNLSNNYPLQGYAPRPESRPLTKFEQRGTGLGHGVWDLIFTRI